MRLHRASSKTFSVRSRWTKTGESLGALKKRGRFKRFIRSEIDADKLASLVEEINSSLNDFLVSRAFSVTSIPLVHSTCTSLKELW